jgi:prepilin-type processing-associated H-X9-DG protein
VRHKTLGFTLIEAVVVVGILAVLLGLLLPAVMAARAAARKAQCLNNLRQIGLAMGAYTQDWQAFPPIASWGNYAGPPQRGRVYSTQSLLLAYVDVNVYNAVNFDLPGLGNGSIAAGNTTVAGTSISTYLCPDDGTAYRGQFAKVSFRANGGLCDGCDDRNLGAFIWGHAGSLAGFTDGLSNTIAYSEKLVGSETDGVFDSRRDWVRVDPPTARTSGEWVSLCSSLPPRLSSKLIGQNGGSTWLIGGGIYTNFFCSVVPNSRTPDCGSIAFNGLGVFGARSNHANGVNILRADGSAGDVQSSINSEVWKGLGTRANAD